MLCYTLLHLVYDRMKVLKTGLSLCVQRCSFLQDFGNKTNRRLYHNPDTEKKRDGKMQGYAGLTLYQLHSWFNS